MDATAANNPNSNGTHATYTECEAIPNIIPADSITMDITMFFKSLINKMFGILPPKGIIYCPDSLSNILWPAESKIS